MFQTGKMVLFLALALATVPASAADCTTKATQAEITDCFGGDFTAADKALNQLYQKLMKTLAADDAKMLQDAQRSWLSFRDKHCAFTSNPASGGSIYPAILSACKAEVTATRVGQLRNKLYCKEGDLGCGS